MPVGHAPVWRWVQHNAPELDRRLRSHLKPSNKSCRVDETCLNKWGETVRRRFPSPILDVVVKISRPL
jgi:transposase-like protein